MHGCAGRLGGARSTSRMQTTIAAMQQYDQLQGPGLAPVTHTARPSLSWTILPAFCPTCPHRAGRRRTAWDDRVHLHPAEQGGYDSGAPSRTDPIRSTRLKPEAFTGWCMHRSSIREVSASYSRACYQSSPTPPRPSTPRRWGRRPGCNRRGWRVLAPVRGPATREGRPPVGHDGAAAKP